MREPDKDAAVTIKTTRGDEVLIDKETLEIIGGRSVFLTGWGKYPAISMNRKPHYLHRLVMDAPQGSQVDHIDGNVLDCRRANLRLASHAQNQRNSRIYRNNRSGFKGVSRYKRTGKWQACIKVDNKLRHLGYFPNPKEAAAAYDKAARELHGEFALTNEELAK